MITYHSVCKSHSELVGSHFQVLISSTEDSWTVRIRLWIRAVSISHRMQTIHAVLISYLALCGSSAWAPLSFPYVLALNSSFSSESLHSYYLPISIQESTSIANHRSHGFGSFLTLVHVSSVLVSWQYRLSTGL